MNDDDDNDGQMIFGVLGDLKVSDIYLTGEEKPRKHLTQETCPDRGSNPAPLRDRRACCRLAHIIVIRILNEIILKISLSDQSRLVLMLLLTAVTKSVPTPEEFSPENNFQRNVTRRLTSYRLSKGTIFL